MSAFDGWYGRLYDRTMSSGVLRRGAARMIWGSGTALAHVAGTVAAAGESATASVLKRTGAPDARATILDVPCGGGTTFLLLDRAGWAGDVVGIDIAEPMLERARRRAAQLRRRESPTTATACLGDALDMPFDDDSFDGAVSVNGLHCLPDPGAFLEQLHRVLRPGAEAAITTLVAPATARERRAMDAVIRLGVIPGPPPSSAELVSRAVRAGFASVEHADERSLVTFRLKTSPS